ncbi:MAG: YoaK family protein [Acidobacteriaceae bacterium]
MESSVDKIPVRASVQDLTGALLLVAVGGYGDAASFVLVGCFTGHTTGNSVLAAIALATGGHLWEPILAVVCFLCATALAQRLRTSPDQPFGSRGFRYVLCAEILLVFVSPFMLMAQHRYAFIACMSIALGLQNGAVSRTDGISLHTTYLTGTLTRLLSLLVEPGSANTSINKSEMRFIPLAWCAFVAGALCGGLTISHAGPKGVWGMPLLLAAVLGISSVAPDAGNSR